LGRRRFVLTVLFSLLFFALLPLSVWVMNAFGFPWLFLGVFGLILVGYALLWRYRLLFLGLLLLLSATGILYKHGDLMFSLLFFLVPYAAACIAIAYRVAERLTPVEWVEPEYPEEEPVYSPGHSRPRLNPYADTRPVLLRREEPDKKATEQQEEDPCGGDELLDLLLERGTEDPEAEKKLHEYMECKARYFIERFEEWEKQHGVMVNRE